MLRTLTNLVEISPRQDGDNFFTEVSTRSSLLVDIVVYCVALHSHACNMRMIRNVTGQWEINGHSAISLPPGHRVTWNENCKSKLFRLRPSDETYHVIAFMTPCSNALLLCDFVNISTLTDFFPSLRFSDIVFATDSVPAVLGTTQDISCPNHLLIYRSWT